MIIKRKRKKTSPVWLIPKGELQEVVKNCNSIADILRYYGYGTTGATHQILKRRLKEDGIDFSHIKLGQNSNKGRKFHFRMTIEESLLNLFVDTNDKTNTSQLRDYILFYNLKEYKCECCNNIGVWQDKKITLQLDHKDGNKHNNKLENLRFLCPNCHSQTDTFGSKNRKKKPKIIRNCSSCKNNIHKNSVSGMCSSCSNLSKSYIEQNLKKEEIEALIWEKSIREISKIFSCSENGLRNFCKRKGIKMPSLGYWQRIKAGHSHELALNPPPRLRKQKPKRFSKEQVLEIKDLITSGEFSLREIARKFNVDHKSIMSIRDNKTYKEFLDGHVADPKYEFAES